MPANPDDRTPILKSLNIGEKTKNKRLKPIYIVVCISAILIFAIESLSWMIPKDVYTKDHSIFIGLFMLLIYSIRDLITFRKSSKSFKATLWVLFSLYLLSFIDMLVGLPYAEYRKIGQAVLIIIGFIFSLLAVFIVKK